jgi:hypothetical protein
MTREPSQVADVDDDAEGGPPGLDEGVGQVGGVADGVAAAAAWRRADGQPGPGLLVQQGRQRVGQAGDVQAPPGPPVAVRSEQLLDLGDGRGQGRAHELIQGRLGVLAQPVGGLLDDGQVGARVGQQGLVGRHLGHDGVHLVVRDQPGQGAAQQRRPQVAAVPDLEQRPGRRVGAQVGVPAAQQLERLGGGRGLGAHPARRRMMRRAGRLTKSDWSRTQSSGENRRSPAAALAGCQPRPDSGSKRSCTKLYLGRCCCP